MTGDATEHRSFADVAASIPRHDRFLGPAEYRERGAALAADHDHVEFRVAGQSREGRDVWYLSVGDGPETAFAFAAAHPNEPAGCATLDFLARELAADDALRASLAYEVVLLPVADPDGLARNRGWLDGPFTLANYAANYYRPAGDEQVEFTFPFEYGDYRFDDPTPEAGAVADVIEAHEPGVVVSLHNGAFCGSYHYLSEPLPGLHGTLESIPGDHGLPLHRWGPEAESADEFADAVYELPDSALLCAELEADGEDPAAFGLGGTSYDFAASVREDAVELVTEVTYFTHPDVADPSPAGRPLRAVRRERADRMAETVDLLRDCLDDAASHLPDGPLRRALADRVDRATVEVEGKREEADETDPEEEATVADVTGDLVLGEFRDALALGLALRLFDRASMRSGGEESVATARRTIERAFHDRLDGVRADLDYDVVPIRNVVAVQARSTLAALDYLQRTDRFE